jgi:hypothetical protein
LIHFELILEQGERDTVSIFYLRIFNFPTPFFEKTVFFCQAGRKIVELRAFCLLGRYLSHIPSGDHTVFLISFLIYAQTCLDCNPNYCVAGRTDTCHHAWLLLVEMESHELIA